MAWFAVFFRLWVRIKIVKEVGWDDGFVFLAQVRSPSWFYTYGMKLTMFQSLNTAATVVMCLSVKTGLGQHMLYIGYNRLVEYLRVFMFLDSDVYGSLTKLAVLH